MERTFETPGPIRLNVRIPAGQLEVEAVETQETHVSVEAPDEVLERTEVEQSGVEIRVHVRNRHGLFFSSGREHVRVRVRCPHRSAVAARTGSADVHGTGPLAGVRVEAGSGDVRLDSVESLEVEAGSSDVTARVVAGSVSVQTASGDVELGHVGGDLSLQCVSGDARVREACGSVRVNSVSGDVRLESVAQGEVRVESVSGDAEVGIRRGSRVRVDAGTLSGETRSELDLGDDEGAEDGPLVDLRVNTVSGDIAVVRATAPQEV